MPRCATSASPPDSRSHRYLPRRETASTRCPVTRAARSCAPARWRRTARAWVMSTAAIVRPATQRARPVRTVSTSGSSGRAGGLVGLGGGAALGDDAERLLGRGLLGLLLAAARARGEGLAADLRARREHLLVVRPGRG